MAAAAITLMTIASAQDAQEGRNQVYNITLGDVQYAHSGEKMSAGEAVGKVLTGVLTGQSLLPTPPAIITTCVSIILSVEFFVNLRKKEDLRRLFPKLAK